MPEIEVEHRGVLDEDKFQELKTFFEKEGESLGLNERFSVIYSQRENDQIKEVYEHPVDLKVRITNGEGELVLKYGKWSGNDARKEFLFPLEKEKFDEMIEFLKILGHYHGVLQATKTYLYRYKGIDFSLVDVPDWGYYFEAEVVTNPEDVQKANEKIEEECRKLGIEALNHEGFCKLLESLNNRPGYRFNLKKQKFSEIKKRFGKYFQL
jgi:adenylate cyclase class IV